MVSDRWRPSSAVTKCATATSTIMARSARREYRRGSPGCQGPHRRNGGNLMVEQGDGNDHTAGPPEPGGIGLHAHARRSLRRAGVMYAAPQAQAAANSGSISASTSRDGRGMTAIGRGPRPSSTARHQCRGREDLAGDQGELGSLVAEANQVVELQAERVEQLCQGPPRSRAHRRSGRRPCLDQPSLLVSRAGNVVCRYRSAFQRAQTPASDRDAGRPPRRRPGSIAGARA